MLLLTTKTDEVYLDNTTGTIILVDYPPVPGTDLYKCMYSVHCIVLEMMGFKKTPTLHVNDTITADP